MQGRSAVGQALGLFLLTLVAWLPGLGRQEYVGTEDLRVQVAREMLDSGDFLVPTLHGRPLLTKPPLHSWALAAVLLATGRHDPFVARLPSLLALAATVVAIALAARAAGGERAGWIAGAGYLLALNTLKNGANAEIDPLFAALAAGAVLAWAAGLLRDRRDAPWLAGLLAGLAALAKGPAILPFVLGALLAGPLAGLGRPRWRSLAALLVPLLLLGLAWPAALLLRGVPAGAVAQGSEILLAWTPERWLRTAGFPLALLVAGAPLSLPVLWRLRSPGRARLDRLLLAAVAVAFLLLLLPANKSTRYLLPCLPLLAVVGALRLEQRGATPAFVRGWAVLLLVAATAAFPVVAGDLDGPGAAALAVLGIAALVAGRLAATAPALALALLVLPARAVLPRVYVPVWESQGESLRPAEESLREMLADGSVIAVVGLQTPRLYLALDLRVRWYPDLEALLRELENGTIPDAVLLPEASGPAPAGWRRMGEVSMAGERRLVVLEPPH